MMPRATALRYEGADRTPTIVPALLPSRYAGEPGKWDVDLVLVTPNGHRHAVGYVDATGTARRTHGADPEPGPYAYAFGLAVAITADPAMSTRAEVERNTVRGIEFSVSDGDVVRLGWDLFAVRIVRRDWIELDHIGTAD